MPAKKPRAVGRKKPAAKSTHEKKGTYVRDRKRNPQGKEKEYLSIQAERHMAEALSKKMITRPEAKAVLRAFKEKGIAFKNVRGFRVRGSEGNRSGWIVELIEQPALGGGTSLFKFITDFKINKKGEVEITNFRRHEKWT